MILTKSKRNVKLIPVLLKNYHTYNNWTVDNFHKLLKYDELRQLFNFYIFFLAYFTCFNMGYEVFSHYIKKLRIDIFGKRGEKDIMVIEITSAASLPNNEERFYNYILHKKDKFSNINNLEKFDKTNFENFLVLLLKIITIKNRKNEYKNLIIEKLMNKNNPHQNWILFLVDGKNIEVVVSPHLSEEWKEFVDSLFLILKHFKSVIVSIPFGLITCKEVSPDVSICLLIKYLLSTVINGNAYKLLHFIYKISNNGELEEEFKKFVIYIRVFFKKSVFKKIKINEYTGLKKELTFEIINKLLKHNGLNGLREVLINNNSSNKESKKLIYNFIEDLISYFLVNYTLLIPSIIENHRITFYKQDGSIDKSNYIRLADLNEDPIQIESRYEFKNNTQGDDLLIRCNKQIKLLKKINSYKN